MEPVPSRRPAPLADSATNSARMATIDNSLMIYLKNDRGICVPIYVKTSDRAEKLYLEAASTRAINRGSLRGKALYHNGRRLDPKELISDLRIAFYDTVRLQSVEEPQSEKDLRQGEEAFPLPKGHEGPIE